MRARGEFCREAVRRVGGAAASSSTRCNRALDRHERIVSLMARGAMSRLMSVLNRTDPVNRGHRRLQQMRVDRVPPCAFPPDPLILKILY